MVKMLELLCLENGDVVLVEADAEQAQAAEATEEPLVRIRFSPEVRDMLGGDTLGVAEAMIEAATAYISGEGEFAGLEFDGAELQSIEFGSERSDGVVDQGDAELEELDDVVSTAPVVLH